MNDLKSINNQIDNILIMIIDAEHGEIMNRIIKCFEDIIDLNNIKSELNVINKYMQIILKETISKNYLTIFDSLLKVKGFINEL